MTTAVKESFAEGTLQEIEIEKGLDNETNHSSKKGIGDAVEKKDHLNPHDCCLSQSENGYCQVNANGVTTFPFTLPEFGSNKSDDEVVDEVCYIGKAKCNCLKGCKCKARIVQLNLFDPAVFEHSNCDDRIKTLEVELRTALDENERLRMENNSLAENFKRVAASTEDAIEMQKNITKASSTIEELKQTVASLADQIPPNRHANGSKSKYGDVIEELRQKEAELKETKYLLRTAEEDVQLHANNLGAMETLMSKQLAQLGAELQATQEELAVKTSQVKQYQMQVEMYRLQVAKLSGNGDPVQAIHAPDLEDH